MRNVWAGAMALGLIVGMLGGCVSGNASSDQVSAKEVLAQLNQPGAPLLVDVRQPEELTGPLGQLPGVVNIPLPELEQRYTEIPKDKPVVLVCRSGNRSGQALSIMKNHGYTQVKNLTGGMNAVRALQPE